MATSLLSTTRFRIIFGICWFSFIQVHAIVLNHYGHTWFTALVDAGVSYTLLAGTALLISVTLQFYIPEKNKYSYLFALVIVLGLAWLFTSRGLLFLFVNEEGYRFFFSASIIIRGAFGFLLLGCMALISVLYYTLQEQQEVLKRKAEAEALSRNAELNNLRQQLQPHFLFNSLNSINALIATKPQQARTMIQQLSDFLRGTLKKEESQLISLHEEMNQLQLYLEIEKVRFGHRMNTSIYNEAPAQARIPALLLQPVVENAIKFGLYDTTDDILITINAKQESNFLVITVTNPYDESGVPKKGTGFGLHSVQRRLYLLFSRNDLLRTEAHDHIFTTTLKIPQQ